MRKEDKRAQELPREVILRTMNRPPKAVIKQPLAGGLNARSAKP